MRLRDLIFVSLVVGGGLALARGVLRPSASAVVPGTAERRLGHADLRPVVAELDAGFRRRWAEKGIQPAAPAPELAVLRRLSLALAGSVPSLEEIRRFEARPARRSARGLAGDSAARSTVGRLPGRAVRSRLRGHRGRPLPPVPPPTVHHLAQRRDPGEPPVRRGRPRPDRRPGTLDRSSGDQLRLGHLQPGERASRPRAAGRAGGAGVPGRAARLRPVSRPPVPALEAGRLPRPGGLLRRRLLEPSGHSRSREHLSARGPQDQGEREGRAPRAVPSGAAAGRRQSARAARRMDRQSGQSQPGPRHGQPGLGPAPGPSAGRAGRRPARLGRASAGPGASRRGLLVARLRPPSPDPDHRRDGGLPARQHGGLAGRDGRPARGDLGRLPADAAPSRAGGGGGLPVGLAADPGAAIALVRAAGHLHRAATTSSAATATPARTSSPRAAGRFPSASCS